MTTQSAPVVAPLAMAPVTIPEPKDEDEGVALVRTSYDDPVALAGYLPAHVEARPQSLADVEAELADHVLKAGLDFTVECSPVLHDFHGNMLTAKGLTKTGRPSPFRVIRRADTGIVFAVSRNVYKPASLINMGSTLSPLVQEGLAAWDGCLNLRNGAIGIVRAKLSLDGIPMIQGDKSPRDWFLCTGTAHDLSMSSVWFLASVRPVCANTLQLAMFQAKRTGKLLKIRHTAGGDARMDAAAAALRAAADTARCYTTVASRLAQEVVTDRQFGEFVEAMLPEGERGITPQLSTSRDAVRGVYASHTTDGIRGTAYGAAEAFGEFSQHLRHAKNDAARMDSTLFGRGATESVKAYQYWMDDRGIEVTASWCDLA